MRSFTCFFAATCACLSIATNVRAQIAYSNLSGQVGPAFTVPAYSQHYLPPFADYVETVLILDDITVAPGYAGRGVSEFTLDFFKAGGTHKAPQMNVSVYDASGPLGGPGKLLDAPGGSASDFPVIGEGSFRFRQFGADPLFTIPADGHFWIGFQFISYAFPTTLPVDEMSSIGTLLFGPAEIGSTKDGVWIGDATSTLLGPARTNPLGSFVSGASLNMGVEIVATPSPVPEASTYGSAAALLLFALVLRRKRSALPSRFAALGIEFPA